MASFANMEKPEASSACTARPPANDPMRSVSFSKLNTSKSIKPLRPQCCRMPFSIIKLACAGTSTSICRCSSRALPAISYNRSSKAGAYLLYKMCISRSYPFIIIIILYPGIFRRKKPHKKKAAIAAHAKALFSLLRGNR